MMSNIAEMLKQVALDLLRGEVITISRDEKKTNNTYISNFAIYTKAMLPRDTAERLFDELIRIRSLLELLASEQLKKKLEAVAKTKDRRHAWSLLDGMTSTTEIAKKVSISQRAVQLFIRDLLKADLVAIERRGYPRRKFDYVPSEWEAENNVE